MGGARVETVGSHLSTTDPAHLGPAAGCGKAESRIDARQPLHRPLRGAAEHLREHYFGWWNHPAAGRLRAVTLTAAMSDDTIMGIPRVDPRARRAAWKSTLQTLATTNAGVAVHRLIGAPLDAFLLKVTGGRLSLAMGAAPVVVLISTGARSGQRRETPLQYFTEGDDVILTASNYGGRRHPGWYHNLLAHPDCELRIGSRGGRFRAREIQGAERDRLFALAAKLYPGYNKYAHRTEGRRTIKVLRLTPA
jgi:deazaflavin-dependent oxidoreductase (nitroreductase family)